MTENGSDSVPAEVFELNENQAAPAQSTAGRIFRLGLYGVALVLFGGLVAVQANPKLADYVTAIPGVSQLTEVEAGTCHGSQSACCSSSSAGEMASSGCPSQGCGGDSQCGSGMTAIAGRPPAPALPETMEVFEL